MLSLSKREHFAFDGLQAFNAMTGPTVLQLRCPACGGALHGTPQAVIFWCGECASVQEVVDGKFVSRPVRAARPTLQARGRLLYLPLWAFCVRVEWTWPDSRSQTTLAWRLPEKVYVTAFTLSNGFYFGDPGLIFTQKQVVLTAGDAGPLMGATRSLVEAKAFVEPHILSLLDRRADVTGLELRCAIDEAILWAVPYYDDGLTLVDGIVGLKLPGAALDEIEALRAWWEQRR